VLGPLGLNGQRGLTTRDVDFVVCGSGDQKGIA
jgi:hypothetical protein